MRGVWLGVAASVVLMGVVGCGEDKGVLDIEVETPRTLNAELVKWTSSRALRVAGDEIFVVDEANDALVVLDRISGAPLRHISVGERPRHVVVGPDGTAWVSSQNAGTVSRILPGASEVASVADVGTAPFGLAMNREATILYVAVMGDDAVVSLDPNSLQEIHRNDGVVQAKLVATNLEHVVVVSGRNTDSTVLMPNLSFNTSRSLRHETSHDRHAELFSRGRGFENTALGAIAHPDLGWVMVAHQIAFPGDFHSRVDRNGAEGSSNSGGYGSTGDGNDFREEQPFIPIPNQSHEATVTPLSPLFVERLSDFDPDCLCFPDLVLDNKGMPLSRRLSLPSDINHHPTMTLAAVVGKASDSMLLINTNNQDPMSKPVGVINTGKAPVAVDFSDDGRFVYVLQSHDFSVGVVDLQPWFDTWEKGQNIRLANGAVEQSFVYGDDPLPAELHAGRRAFTFAKTDGLSRFNTMSCEMCHIDGTDDGAVWMTALGPRQTPSLAGRVEGTAPFSWSGTNATLMGNMVETVDRMGGGGLDPTMLSSLEGFLHTLEPLPLPNRELTELEERGRALFFDADVGCASCHGGDASTDGANYNVGVVSFIELEAEFLNSGEENFEDVVAPTYNTPSLKGLRYTAPYFHDGSSADLETVLWDTIGTMGTTAHLTDEDMQALVAYMKMM